MTNINRIRNLIQTTTPSTTKFDSKGRSIPVKA